MKKDKAVVFTSVLRAGSALNLEERINKDINSHEEAEVVDVKFTVTCYGEFGDLLYAALILYKMKG